MAGALPSRSPVPIAIGRLLAQRSPCNRTPEPGAPFAYRGAVIEEAAQAKPPEAGVFAPVLQPAPCPERRDHEHDNRREEPQHGDPREQRRQRTGAQHDREIFGLFHHFFTLALTKSDLTVTTADPALDHRSRMNDIIEHTRVEGEILIMVDGQMKIIATHQTEVEITRAPHAVKLVKPQGSSYFGTLRNKLMWAGFAIAADGAPRDLTLTSSTGHGVLDRGDHVRMTVAGVQHRDAAGEVDVALALDVPNFSIRGPVGIDGQ